VSEIRRWFSGWFDRVSVRNLADSQRSYVISLVLFAFSAWPLTLTEVPPLQDLPNHLAAVSIIDRLSSYPEFVFNGFAKTNSALFVWLACFGKFVGYHTAARGFAWVVLAANALVWPRFVLSLTGDRRQMLVATFFIWPMIHPWFVSMGMLDFALSVPLSLAMLMALAKHARSPSPVTAVVVIALGIATWFAHVFALLVVHALVLIEAFAGGPSQSWSGRARRLAVMAWPLSPLTALVMVSVREHFRGADGPILGMLHHSSSAPPWELAYNFWAEWFWGFTKLSMTSVVPCVLLVVLALWRRACERGNEDGRRESPMFFSSAALCALVLLFCFTPYRLTNWYHVNSRFIPYVCAALLLRLPRRLPRFVAPILTASAMCYWLGMGVDYVRLDRDRLNFVAAAQDVPEGARLLPLIFNHKGRSENTRSLLHAWGFYVEQKHTSAPLLFAHSKSFPVTYASEPPLRFHALVLENFAASMASAERFCQVQRPFTDACEREFRVRWAEFWKEATPRFDYVLMWEPSPEALELVPEDFRVAKRDGGLVLLSRQSDAAEAMR